MSENANLSKEPLQKFADVEVTQNFLRIKDAGLHIDQRTLTGTQILESLGGLYPFKCSYQD